MTSLNKVMLIGSLGRDPEIRHTGEGKAIANISLATSEKWKGKDGNYQEKTEWHRIVVFGRLAEICEKYLKKGSQVHFEGKLQTRKWQNKEGNDQYSTEVVVDVSGNMVMLGGKNNDAPAKQESEKEDLPFDDSIPF